ncbi:MAG: glycogen/starch/alpha-glucan phosphorylase, partial [Agathobacter rectalis]
LLSNNLINLGIYDEVKETLEKNGKSLAEIEEIELEPSLGNGGLGRLAACFIDSIATLGLNGDGVGLNYHYGLFKQVFENNLQKETPNPWITKESWLTKTDITYPVSFGGFTVQSRLYDIDVVGYNNRTTKLHLFDIESVDESIVGDTIDFDKDDIKKNLTLFLYPDDSDDKGRLLRVYQQYFMVSNAARLILAEAEAKGSNLHDLADYAAVQINDTHPSMVIPELIRLLQEKGILMDEAIEIVSKVCAYTNHTILAEALEKWPISFLEKAVPQLMPIIRELDNKVRAKVADESTYIIKDGLVHMAHMDIHFGYSVNGVAYLHTEILKNTELNNFYKLYPEKFNNKTNGITFRRWLMSCNPELSAYITELIGEGWKKDANELEKLGNFINDDTVLTKLVDIKNAKKTELASYLKKTQNLDVPDNSIFDIQVKRLHEYKRQQLNVLYIIRKYFEIKAGKKPSTPITCFFGAKAAPAYIIAKDIIHAILCLQQIINNDPEVSPYLKVFMVENYNVTLAEKLFPAANISEQISLASKEASGTGNMKFMLNGAITLGTSDGANVEIAELVGDENIYVFGEDSQTVIDRYERGDYCSKDYYDKDADLKKAVDFLVSDEMMKVGSKENLERLYNELLNKDWFMTFPDFEDYCKTKEKAYADYEDKKAWAKKMLVNISKAGFFSSDRTIKQYNDEIWHLEA